MMKFFSIAAVTVMMFTTTAFAAENSESNIDIEVPQRYERMFPIWAQDAIDLGHELPKPFGFNFTHMAMDQPLVIDSISLNGLGPVLDDLIQIEGNDAVQDSETVTFRADMWLLPFMNVYGVLGYTEGNSKAWVDLTIGDSQTIAVPFDLEFEGLTYGGGVTLVGGIGNWFAMVDTNYTLTDLDILDGEISSLVISPRTGIRTQIFGNEAQMWVGAMYQRVQQTFGGYLGDIIPALGNLRPEARFEVEQHLEDQWNGLIGGQVALGNGFDLLVEGGFGTRKSLMIALGYRF
ncbi:virulence protein [Shewanella maritima]|uniref:virulence protein n=1 Tax=Shewanella maritima TaxID=2520507 RepID=UPI003734FB1E